MVLARGVKVEVQFQTIKDHVLGRLFLVPVDKGKPMLVNVRIAHIIQMVKQTRLNV
jgi:hypothetical protein